MLNGEVKEMIVIETPKKPYFMMETTKHKS